MQSFVRDRFRFFALLVALVAVLSLTPLLLAQGGVQCGDQVVSSFEECKKLVKGDGEAMADGDGMMMEDGDGEGMEDGDGMMMMKDDDFWPSRWGADDQAGASNWITPEKVMAAVSLIETGEIYELGRPYTHGMPLFGQRTYSLTIPARPPADLSPVA